MWEKLSENKKVLCCIAIGITAIFLLIGFYIIGVKSNKEQEQITKNEARLTELYEEEQKNMSNGIGGSTINIYDESGNIIEERGNESGKDINKLTEKEEAEKKDDDKFFIEFIEKMNKKDFKSIYSLFNKDYLNFYEIDEEDINIRYGFNNNVKYEITNTKNYEENGSKIITVKFTEEGTNNMKIVDFTIFNDGTIADKGIEYIKKVNSSKTIEGVTYTVGEVYAEKLNATYEIIIENNSENLVKITNIIPYWNENRYASEIVSKNTEVEV
ncbi:MAG: hypothetical protein ACLTYB_16695, partial [Clostridium paraputrificum]